MTEKSSHEIAKLECRKEYLEKLRKSNDDFRKMSIFNGVNF